MRSFLLNLLTIVLILVILAVGITAVRAFNSYDGRNLVDYTRPLTVPEGQPAAATVIQIVTATPEPLVPVVADAAQPIEMVADPQPPAQSDQETAVTYDPEFLFACADGQRAGRRVSPRCPTNAAELLGAGR